MARRSGITGADLQNHLERYLELRQALGYAKWQQGPLLQDFLTFLQGRTLAEPLMAQAAVDWACSHGGPEWQSRRLSVARGFLIHLRVYLPGITVPAPGIIQCGVRPTPYIFSKAQIVMLMDEALKLEPKEGLRPHTFTTLIGLLASCGLRPGEAIRLRDVDVELDCMPPRLVIRETKFRKSRLVPVDSTTADALRSYVRTRKRLGYDKLSPTFFVSESGTPLVYCSVGRTFLKMLRRLGIHGSVHSGARSPNLQCLRHTFAVRRMRDWYSQGMDVRKHLPHLSVYLGHVKVHCTYWYLTATPDLLGEAGSRFESYVSGRGEL